MDKTMDPVDSEKYAPTIDDAESVVPSSSETTTPAKRDLKRGLKARHIQMIALGGTIGTFFTYALLSPKDLSLI